MSGYAGLFFSLLGCKIGRALFGILNLLSDTTEKQKLLHFSTELNGIWKEAQEFAELNDYVSRVQKWYFPAPSEFNKGYPSQGKAQIFVLDC